MAVVRRPGARTLYVSECDACNSPLLHATTARRGCIVGAGLMALEGSIEVPGVGSVPLVRTEAMFACHKETPELHGWRSFLPARGYVLLDTARYTGREAESYDPVMHSLPVVRSEGG